MTTQALADILAAAVADYLQKQEPDAKLTDQQAMAIAQSILQFQTIVRNPKKQPKGRARLDCQIRLDPAGLKILQLAAGLADHIETCLTQYHDYQFKEAVIHNHQHEPDSDDGWTIIAISIEIPYP